MKSNINESLVETLINKSNKIKRLADEKKLDFLDIENIQRATNILTRIIKNYSDQKIDL